MVDLRVTHGKFMVNLRLTRGEFVIDLYLARGEACRRYNVYEISYIALHGRCGRINGSDS